MKLPEVAGRRVNRTPAAFVQAALVCLAAEQEKPNPDNALVAVLCDTVRLVREYEDGIAAGLLSPDPPKKHPGTVYPKTAIFLHEDVGKAETEEGIYRLTRHFGTSVPIVHSSKTDQSFSLSWQEILNLAIAAGIDREIIDAPTADANSGGETSTTG